MQVTLRAVKTREEAEAAVTAAPPPSPESKRDGPPEDGTAVRFSMMELG